MYLVAIVDGFQLSRLLLPCLIHEFLGQLSRARDRPFWFRLQQHTRFGFAVDEDVNQGRLSALTPSGNTGRYGAAGKSDWSE